MSHITLSEFTEKTGRLHAEICSYYLGLPNGNTLITDGIVNVKEYYSSPIKIMWVLKEPYGVGNYSIVNDLDINRAEGKKHDSPRTWDPICYASYGIQNNFKLFQEIGSFATNPDIRRALKKIAYINVKKLPGLSKSNNREIQRTYQRDKNILLKQIETYNPDVVIGGNTLAYFKNDFQLNDEHRLSSDESTIYRQRWVVDRKLFIHAHHPMTFRVSQKAYVDDLIGTASSWYKQIDGSPH